MKCLVAINIHSKIGQALTVTGNINRDMEDEVFDFIVHAWSLGYSVRLVELSKYVVTIGQPLRTIIV